MQEFSRAGVNPHFTNVDWLTEGQLKKTRAC